MKKRQARKMLNRWMAGEGHYTKAQIKKIVKFQVRESLDALAFFEKKFTQGILASYRACGFDVR